MRYTFEHDEIKSCADCPLFYDNYLCMLEKHAEVHGHEPHDWWNGFTWDGDGHRPEWCLLKEAS